MEWMNSVQQRGHHKAVVLHHGQLALYLPWAGARDIHALDTLEGTGLLSCLKAGCDTMGGRRRGWISLVVSHEPWCMAPVV